MSKRWIDFFRSEVELHKKQYASTTTFSLQKIRESIEKHSYRASSVSVSGGDEPENLPFLLEELAQQPKDGSGQGVRLTGQVPYHQTEPPIDTEQPMILSMSELEIILDHNESDVQGDKDIRQGRLRREDVLWSEEDSDVDDSGGYYEPPKVPQQEYRPSVDEEDLTQTRGESYQGPYQQKSPREELSFSGAPRSAEQYLPAREGVKDDVREDTTGIEDGDDIAPPALLETSPIGNGQGGYRAPDSVEQDTGNSVSPYEDTSPYESARPFYKQASGEQEKRYPGRKHEKGMLQSEISGQNGAASTVVDEKYPGVHSQWSGQKLSDIEVPVGETDENATRGEPEKSWRSRMYSGVSNIYGKTSSIWKKTSKRVKATAMGMAATAALGIVYMSWSPAIHDAVGRAGGLIENSVQVRLERIIEQDEVITDKVMEQDKAGENDKPGKIEPWITGLGRLGRTDTGIADNSEEIVDSRERAVAVRDASAESPLRDISYTVERGDSPWGLARAYLRDGRRWNEIKKMDGSQLSEGSVIHPGEVLLIPSSDAVSRDGAVGLSAKIGSGVVVGSDLAAQEYGGRSGREGIGPIRQGVERIAGQISRSNLENQVQENQASGQVRPRHPERISRSAAQERIDGVVDRIIERAERRGGQRGHGDNEEISEERADDVDGYRIREGDSYWGISREFLGSGKYYQFIGMVHDKTTLRMGEKLPISSNFAFYTVRAGETAWGLARKVSVISRQRVVEVYEKIAAANPDIDLNLIYASRTKIKIPLSIFN